MPSPSALQAVLIILVLAPVSAAQGILEGSFETAASGSPPASPWVVTGGVATVTDVPDALLPSQGTQYLVIGSDGTGPATPGYGPHASGTVGQVTQSFVRPSGPRLHLSFSWEWLPSEALPSASFNDFFSVDLLDSLGNLVANILFLDTGRIAVVDSSFVYTNVPGVCTQIFGIADPPNFVAGQSSVYSPTGTLAPAGFKRAWIDLSAITSPGVSYSLQFSVGNGGDASVISHAYVDDVTLYMAERNSSDASVRVLGTSHVDGVLTSLDHGGDTRPETPFIYRTKPGGSFSIRASSQNTGVAWALFHGTLLPIGNDFGVLGVSNIDLTKPFGTVVNGIGGTSLIDIFLGTIPSDGTAFLEGSLPAATPLDSKVVVQALFIDPTGPGPFIHSAATDVVVGSNPIPRGLNLVPGDAQNYFDYSIHNFGSFGGGSFSFYDVAHTQVYIHSAGYLSFGFANDVTETGDELLTGPPRIAVLWDDWNPGVVEADVTFTETSDTFTVSWNNVPEFLNAPGSDFSIQLYSDGSFTMFYGTLLLSDGLVGVSPGGLSAGSFISSDVSSTQISFGQCGSLVMGGLFQPPVPAYFQQFGLGDSCDLSTVGTTGPPRLTFVNDPDATSFYKIYSGTR